MKYIITNNIAIEDKDTGDIVYFDRLNDKFSIMIYQKDVPGRSLANLTREQALMIIQGLKNILGLDK